jgi:peptidylprolyl isomerase
VAAAYESNTAAFAAPTEYRIAQIFVSAPDGADPARTSAALAKVADIGRQLPASDFAALARLQSEHAESAPKGGDLGFLAGDRLLPEVAAAIRGLAPGQVVGPVKTGQGLHFLKLLETKPGAVPALGDIKGAIAAAMRDTRVRQLEQAYLNDLGARSGVTVNQIALARMLPALQ